MTPTIHAPDKDDQRRPTAIADLEVFNAIEAAFRASAQPPNPLALDGVELGYGLPDRLVDLVEVRTILLSRRIPQAGQDAAWRQVIYRARGDDEPTAWRLAALGLALPGLRAEAGRLTHEFGQLDGDLHQDLITVFLDALDRIDSERRHLAAKLMDAIKTVGIRLRYADAPLLPLYREDIRHLGVSPRLPFGHPELVLIDAIAKDVLTNPEAELIARTRIEHHTIPTIAAETGELADTLYQRRYRAEARLVYAIHTGKVRASLTPPAA